MSTTARKSQARWRKAKGPTGRYNTPMNRLIWNRDHGRDRELWRGNVHLATATPGGGWTIHIGRRPRGVCVGESLTRQGLAEKAAKDAAMIEETHIAVQDDGS